MTRKHAVGLFVTLVAVWLLLSGYFNPLLLSLGLVSCLLVLSVTFRMRILDEETLPMHLASRLPRLVWELFSAILASNRDLALLLLRGEAARPVVRTLDLGTRRPLTQTAVGNAITLTPGTLTMGVTGNQMTIHALTPEMVDGLEDTAMIRVFREIDNA